MIEKGDPTEAGAAQYGTLIIFEQGANVNVNAKLTYYIIKTVQRVILADI